MARGNPRAQKVAAPHVGHFLKRLHDDLSHGSPTRHDGTWFSRRGEGSLFLNREETAEYYQLLDQLVRWAAPNESLSRKAVHTFLADAMFEALDLQGKQKLPFGHRLGAAKKHLFTRLAAPSEHYKVWIPVEGLSLDGPQARFGGVRFVRFGAAQIRAMARKRPVPTSTGTRWKSVVAFEKADLVAGHVYAVLTVSARDSDAAERLATLRVRAAIDLLNFFTDIVPYCNGWLYLRAETTRAHQVVMVQDAQGAVAAKRESLDPLAAVSWKALRKERWLAPTLRMLDKLVQSDPASDSYAGALLAAAQWAGRATVDRRRENSFLLYAIALETMLLPERETQSSAYRLKLRAALLLGKTPKRRAALLEELADLYGKRSRIVHAGSYDVTDADLARLRSITKGLLVRLASLRRFHTVTRKAFAAELEARLVG